MFIGMHVIVAILFIICSLSGFLVIFIGDQHEPCVSPSRAQNVGGKTRSMPVLDRQILDNRPDAVFTGLNPQSNTANAVAVVLVSTTFKGSEWAYIVQIDALSTPKVSGSVDRVSQIIPGGQQEGEHGVVHQVQGEHYKRKF